MWWQIALVALAVAETELLYQKIDQAFGELLPRITCLSKSETHEILLDLYMAAKIAVVLMAAWSLFFGLGQPIAVALVLVLQILVLSSVHALGRLGQDQDNEGWWKFVNLIHLLPEGPIGAVDKRLKTWVKVVNWSTHLVAICLCYLVANSFGWLP